MERSVYPSIHLILLLVLVVLCRYGVKILAERSTVSGMEISDLEGESFRAQELDQDLVDELKELYHGTGRTGLADTVAATMFMGHFQPEKICTEAPMMEMYKAKVWEAGQRAYQAVWGDLECFPLPGEEVSYEDSWLSPRGASGERQHEGCDLFGPEDLPGQYPVVSITDGVVEQIGWLPLGGYRIGIRSPKGGYFYYAHLDSYGREFETGDKIQAGQVLGFMGNSGYGPEGTRGQFSTHLHLGIYIQTEEHPELSVDPYWILRFLENDHKKLSYLGKQKTGSYGIL